MFIIDICSPLQLAITLYLIREGQRIEKLKYGWNSSYLVRDLTFENSSFMSLATTFSLWSMQCVIHGSCLCTSRHILARVYHVHGKNCRSLWKSLNFFVRPCSCLQNINSSCISFWSTTTQTLKAEGRLTRLWIHLIVVQNNLLSGVSRLVVPSHQLPIHQ